MTSPYLRVAALAARIGMVSVPDAIVNKPGALSREEWSVMRQHAPLGASLVALSPDAAEKDARLVARRRLARLARHYALLPTPWATAQGQVVDRSAFDSHPRSSA